MNTLRRYGFRCFKRVRCRLQADLDSEPTSVLSEAVCNLQSGLILDSCRKFNSFTPCQAFFNQSKFSNKTKEYTGRKLVGFSMEQMYEVVADVENYKKFVPFCKRSVIVERKPGSLKAELSIGFPPVNESYVSNVTLIHPRLVKAECTQGHLFDHLTTTWKFSPGLPNQSQTCVIDFHVSFSFRSSLHSHLAHIFFNELVRQMESAFFTEAQKRFGVPTIQTLKLEKPKSS